MNTSLQNRAPAASAAELAALRDRFAAQPSLSIGGIKIPSRVFMAPMMGYNEPPLRTIQRRFGAGLCITEMIKPEEMVQPPKVLIAELQLEADIHPVSAQISGRDPAPAIYAATRLREMGFDIIDLNFGCPNKKECGRGRGAVMMKHPELVEDLIRSLTRELDCPVTVKLRSGWSEGAPTAPHIARVAVDSGAAAVCVHGRSKEGHYRTQNDLDVIAATRAAVPEVPFIANGDVIDLDSAVRMFCHTGADAVMVGRGSVGNPWIFQRINHALQTGQRLALPSFAEVCDLYEEHIRGLLRCFKEVLALRFARKYFFFYFARWLPMDMRHEIGRAASIEELMSSARRLAELPAQTDEESPLAAMREAFGDDD